jgi:hypothetical protein
MQATIQLAAKFHAANIASLPSRRRKQYNSGIDYAGNAQRN